MDFLPSKDLEDFIISEVLRKEIDQMMAEGHRFDIATTFVADKQHRTSHSLGTTRRATPATLIVRCRRSDIADWSDLVCDFDSNPTTSLAKRVSWRLTAGVRRDEKGYYLTRRQFVSLGAAAGTT
jgi:hypothetical protein